VKGKKDLNKATQELLGEMVKEFKPILFDGDNYTTEWHVEAERRGLPNLRNTVDAVPLATSKEAVELFTKYKVYSRRELHSRQDILLENYCKTINIEALTASTIANTMILPVCLRYQTEVAGAVNAAQTAGVEDATQSDLLRELIEAISALRSATLTLDAAIAHQPHGGLMEHAKYERDTVIPAMESLRKCVDKLESMVADDGWPLPKYREMLFIR
jgi:glutamine synthetase